MRAQRRARQARLALGALGLLGAVGCESMVIPSDDVGMDDTPITMPLGVASNANPGGRGGSATVGSGEGAPPAAGRAAFAPGCARDTPGIVGDDGSLVAYLP